MGKEKIYNYCVSTLLQKLKDFEKRKYELSEALNSESKSSVGDKHETGRAMIQLEREKLGVQLAKTESNYRKIQTLKNNHSSVIVGIGSLVITNKANYYIGISLGVCKFGDESCYCISPESPIGILLLGKKLGEIIDFNNDISTILSII